MRHPPRWLVAFVLGIALLPLSFISYDYVGRVNDRERLIQGCQRSALDRADNASGWRTAQAVWLSVAARHGPIAGTAKSTARKYGRIAASLEARTRPTVAGRTAFCIRLAYPPISPFPWRG